MRAHAERRRTRGAAGFVLSELALVVIVVSALLLVVVVSVDGIHDSNSKGRCETQIRLLKVAVDRFHVEQNGKYPIKMSELTKLDLITLDEVPDYTLHSGGPAERPSFRPRGDCA